MKKVLFALCAALLVLSCGSRNNNGLTSVNASEDKSGKVNVLEQSKPSIMVIPSDQCLKKAGYMKQYDMNGRTVYERDYNGYLMNNEQNKAVIRAIQSFFIQNNYPLTDLEQTLKSLTNESVMDSADGVAKDAKTLLVSTCRPDIILEADFAEKTEMATRTTVKKTTDFTITALDAFTNKAVSAFNKLGITGSVADYLSSSFQKESGDFIRQIQGYFKDIVVNGREITFRVQIDQKCAINLTDEINDSGDTYSDWIREWIKSNAKNGTANMQRNTAKEMYFSNVRISNLSEDGTQFNAYDFATIFRKNFLQSFQMRCLNTTQGLGDASVIIQ